MINNVIIEGYLTNDVAINDTGKTKFCKFSIGWNETYKETKTSHFLPCVVFDKTAEYMEKYFHKGDLVSIEGKVTQSKWTDKEGKEKSTIGITVRSINILRKKNNDASKPNNVAPSFEESFPF